LTGPSTVTAPARGRVELRRQCGAGAERCFTVYCVGPECLTSADVEAITELVKSVDTGSMLSIERRGDEVIAVTGWIWLDCGSGTDYGLRKIRGTWVIISRSSWVV